jgi:preprotein translocase subunit SecG
MTRPWWVEGETARNLPIDLRQPSAGLPPPYRPGTLGSNAPLLLPLYNLQGAAHIPALMWLSILIPILLVILVVVCLLLTLVVLMQRPRSEGLGAAFGSGMTENIFGAQTSSVLTKATVYLGAIFFGVTLLLTFLTARQSMERRAGVLESEARKAKPVVTASPSPLASSTPAAAVTPGGSASASAAASPSASPTASAETSPTVTPQATPTVTPQNMVTPSPSAGNTGPSPSPNP